MVDCIETVYGTVRLSKKTLAYMNNLNPGWREIAKNKRKRNQAATEIRAEIERMEITAGFLADVEFYAGGRLKKI